MEFNELLNKSYTSAQKDVHTFKKWENGHITTDECIKEFLSNNGHVFWRYSIDEYKFIKWLNSLGWKRGVEDWQN